MLFTLIRDAMTWLLNVLIRRWNFLPLGSSLKIKPIGESRNSTSTTQTSPPEEMRRDNGLTHEERKTQYLWLLRLMVALAIPVILETLDYTVVATAQPKIASAFNRLNLQSYIGTIYLLTSTVFLPLFASLADVYGRHLAMQLSLVFFLIGSALSTAAQNMAMMLAGRGIAGIGAAGMLTVLRTILADSRSLNTNNLQSAVMTILYTIGFCIGPAIGGALVDISFRWVFAINLPCSVVSMILIFVLLRKHTKRPLSGQNISWVDKLLRIDWTGTIFFTIGGIGVLLGLNWGSTDGWVNVKDIVALVVGGVLICVTLGWEFILEHEQDSTRASLRNDPEATDSNSGVNEKPIFPDSSVERVRLRPLFRANALLPLSVMGHYDVMACNLAALTSGMVMLVVFYFVSLFFIIVTGKSATDSGVQLLYFAPGLGIGTVVSIKMVSVLRQPKYPIVLGGIIIPIALGLESMAVDNNKEGQLKAFMIMAGIGVGMTFGPLAMHARFSQPSERVAIVSALNLFFRSLGGTIGLAQCGTVTNAKVNAYFRGLPASTLAELQSLGASSFTAADLTSIAQINALPPDVQELVRNAYRNGVKWSFISLIPWAGVSLLACLYLRKIEDPDAVRRRDSLQQQQQQQQQETVTVPGVGSSAGHGRETLPSLQGQQSSNVEMKEEPRSTATVPKL